MLTKILSHRSTAFTPMLILAVLFMLAFLLSGCAVTPKAEAVDPQASQAAAPAPAPDTLEPPAEEDNGVLAFGETVTWDNNVSLSVSVPAPYTPTEYAAGTVEGQSVVAFEFVLTNNSGENYEPFVYGTATSGGVEAPGVFDTSNGMSLPPTTVLLDGQTIKWTQAFSVADPANITMQVSAGFEYDDAIYTNAQ